MPESAGVGGGSGGGGGGDGAGGGAAGGEVGGDVPPSPQADRSRPAPRNRMDTRLHPRAAAVPHRTDFMGYRLSFGADNRDSRMPQEFTHSVDSSPAVRGCQWVSATGPLATDRTGPPPPVRPAPGCATGPRRRQTPRVRRGNKTPPGSNFRWAARKRGERTLLPSAAGRRTSPAPALPGRRAVRGAPGDAQPGRAAGNRSAGGRQESGRRLR